MQYKKVFTQNFKIPATTRGFKKLLYIDEIIKYKFITRRKVKINTLSETLGSAGE